MFTKLKGEDHYHLCREHLEELDKLDDLEPGQLAGRQYSEPEDGKICKECQALAEKGDCTPIFVQVGSHADET